MFSPRRRLYEPEALFDIRYSNTSRILSHSLVPLYASPRRVDLWVIVSSLEKALEEANAFEKLKALDWHNTENSQKIWCFWKERKNFRFLALKKNISADIS